MGMHVRLARWVDGCCVARWINEWMDERCFEPTPTWLLALDLTYRVADRVEHDLTNEESIEGRPTRYTSTEAPHIVLVKPWFTHGKVEVLGVVS